MVNSSPGLFSHRFTDQLADVLRRSYASELIEDRLGPVGHSALQRSDIAGVERLTRDGSPTSTLIRLFLLGLAVPLPEVRAALEPISPAQAQAEGLLSSEGTTARATLDIRPYAETDGPQWWVVSDLSSDVKHGPVDAEHVLGVGSAGITLAQAVVRTPVASAADIGTGCGLQALHLARHCSSVTATDLSARALALAATNARLNSQQWEFRQGSLLDPLGAEQFDLLVCNPPFVVGPGLSADDGGYRYRDSGLAGDEVSRRLVTGIPARLNHGGTGQLLINWCITDGQSWQERVGGWLVGSGCDAWVWQRELVEPGAYVTQWLIDAGLQRLSPQWSARYNEWMDWFDASGVLAVGMGLVSMRRTDAATTVVVAEDLRQPLEQPIGPAIDGWLRRARWLAEHDDDALMRSPLYAAADLVLSVQSVLSVLGSPGDGGWSAALSELRQAGGARWNLEVDAAMTAVVGACTGSVPVGLLLELASAAASEPLASSTEGAVAAVRDLVQRGLLSPYGLACP